MNLKRYEEMMKYSLKLATKIFRNNRVKNIIIIATIALSFTFIMLYLTIAETLDDYLFQNNLMQIGTEAEAEYLDVTYEDYQRFKGENSTLKVSYGTTLGEFFGGENNSKVIAVRYFEENAAELCFAELIEGKWANDENEIVLDTNYCQYIEEVCVGDELNVAGTSFVVAGICDSNPKAGQSGIYLSEAAFHMYEEPSVGMVYVDLDDIDGAKSKLVNEWSFVFHEDNQKVFINPVYENEQNRNSDIMTIVVCILVFIVSYFTIYSVYYNSVIKEVKFYGQLKLLGMKRMQLHIIVQLQALLQYIIGILVGGLLTVSFGGIVRMLFTQSILKGELEFVYEHFYFVCAMLISFLAVVLGANKSSKYLSTLSLVKAVDYLPHMKFRVSRRGYAKYSTISFAYRNISRNRRRSFVVAFSFTFSIMLFVFTINTINFFENVYTDIGKMSDDFIIADESVLNARLSNVLGEESFLYRSNITGEPEAKLDRDIIKLVEKKCAHSKVNGYYLVESWMSSDFIKERVDSYIMQRKYKDEELINLQRSRENAKAFGLEEEWGYMQYYIGYEDIKDCNVIEGKLDEALFDSGNYVVIMTSSNLKTTESFFHPGEKIMVRDVEGEENAVRELEVMAVISEKPEACVYEYFMTCFLPKNMVEDINTDEVILYAIAINSYDVEKEEMSVYEIANRYQVSYISNEIFRREEKSMEKIMMFFGCGISAVIGIMAFMNFFNNYALSLQERKEEFVILRIIGMTKKQLISIIRMENRILMGTTAMVGYIIGTIVSVVLLSVIYGEYKGFEEYLELDYIFGFGIITIVLLLSGIFPNRKTRLGENGGWE